MYVVIEIPEIDQHPNGFPRFWTKTLFMQSISSHSQINALAGTYVRLVEAALVEYRLGTKALKQFWEDHTSFNIGAMHRAVSHFESCLSDMHRAINCFRRLRRHKEIGRLSDVLNDEKPQFARDKVFDQIRTLRDSIIHLEEMVLDGRLPQGTPFALKADGPETPHPAEPGQTIKTIDRLVIGRHEMLFANLAIWLGEMGRVAEKIALYDAPNDKGS